MPWNVQSKIPHHNPPTSPNHLIEFSMPQCQRLVPYLVTSIKHNTGTNTSLCIRSSDRTNRNRYLTDWPQHILDREAEAEKDKDTYTHTHTFIARNKRERKQVYLDKAAGKPSYRERNGETCHVPCALQTHPHSLKSPCKSVSHNVTGCTIQNSRSARFMSGKLCHEALNHS